MPSLTLWAAAGLPPTETPSAVLWAEFLPEHPPSDWHSLPELVDEHKIDLRADYLSWVHRLGGVDGGGLADRLAIRSNLSYWWMTLPTINSIQSDSPVYTAVRMLALARLVDALHASSIEVVGGSVVLRDVIREWASTNGRNVVFHPSTAEHRELQSSKGRRLRDRAYRRFPSLAAMRVIVSHAAIAVRRRRPVESIESAGDLMFVDFLAHLEPGSLTGGQFASNYWGPLVERLESTRPATFMHLPAEFAVSRVVERDDALVEAFDRLGTRNRHEYSHRWVSARVVMSAVTEYFRVRRLGRQVRRARPHFVHASTGVDLWPAFRDSYRDQYLGKSAMLNCIWLGLFDRLLERAPRQELGVYLFENQPWELAFISAWRRAGHGRLIGWSHSSMLFWDTRVFKDPRDEWQKEGDQPMPWPDMIAVNSQRMRESCLEAGYPADRCHDVEALRYLSLHQAQTVSRPPQTPSLLVLGEYGLEETQRLVDTVSGAVRSLDWRPSVRVRLHPASGGLPRLNEGVDWHIDQLATLTDSLADCTTVICGPLTTAALEAWLMTGGVLVVLDPHVPVASPVEGLPNVEFSHNITELERQLAGCEDRSGKHAQKSPFFRGEDLSAWGRILNLGTEEPPPSAG